MKSSVQIKQLLPDSDFKILRISGDAGDRLESHKVDQSAALLVASGRVTYEEEGTSKELSSGEGQTIPAETYHSLNCEETSEVFVVIPKRAKMKFER